METPLQSNMTELNIAYQLWLAARLKYDGAVGREAIKIARAEEHAARCKYQMECLKK